MLCIDSKNFVEPGIYEFSIPVTFAETLNRIFIWKLSLEKNVGLFRSCVFVGFEFVLAMNF